MHSIHTLRKMVSCKMGFKIACHFLQIKIDTSKRADAALPSAYPIDRLGQHPDGMGNDGLGEFHLLLLVFQHLTGMHGRRMSSVHFGSPSMVIDNLRARCAQGFPPKTYPESDSDFELLTKVRTRAFSHEGIKGKVKNVVPAGHRSRPIQELLSNFPELNFSQNSLL